MRIANLLVSTVYESLVNTSTFLTTPLSNYHPYHLPTSSKLRPDYLILISSQSQLIPPVKPLHKVLHFIRISVRA